MKPVELAKIRSDLIHTVRTGAVVIGASFEQPDDDWDAMAFGANADGEAVIVAIDPKYFSSAEAKDELADDVLPAVIKKFDFVAMAMVMSVWITVYDKHARESPDLVERHVAGGVQPGGTRTERLFLLGLDRYGEEYYTAQIIRHKDAPPTLEPWERFDAGMSIGGRFVPPMREALRPQG